MKLPVEPAHFARWLVLFERTAREVCPAAGAALLMEKARRIAHSLEMGVDVQRGKMPGWRNA